MYQNNNKRKASNEKGVILLLTVFIILFMSILIIGYLEVAATETEIMRNHKLSTEALYIAEAGIEDAIYTIRQTDNHHWAAGFTDKIFPDGSSSSYTVTIDNSSYPDIVITSTGTVSNTFQRRIEAAITIFGPPISAPYPISIKYWKEI